MQRSMSEHGTVRAYKQRFCLSDIDNNESIFERNAVRIKNIELTNELARSKAECARLQLVIVDQEKEQLDIICQTASEKKITKESQSMLINLIKSAKNIFSEINKILEAECELPNCESFLKTMIEPSCSKIFRSPETEKRLKTSINQNSETSKHDSVIEHEGNIFPPDTKNTKPGILFKKLTTKINPHTTKPSNPRGRTRKKDSAVIEHRRVVTSPDDTSLSFIVLRNKAVPRISSVFKKNELKIYSDDSETDSSLTVHGNTPRGSKTLKKPNDVFSLGDEGFKIGIPGSKSIKIPVSRSKSVRSVVKNPKSCVIPRKTRTLTRTLTKSNVELADVPVKSKVSRSKIISTTEVKGSAKSMVKSKK